MFRGVIKTTQSKCFGGLYKGATVSLTSSSSCCSFACEMSMTHDYQIRHLQQPRHPLPCPSESSCQTTLVQRLRPTQRR
eukprot:2653414-Amphidinium_carterae.1